MAGVGCGRRAAVHCYKKNIEIFRAMTSRRNSIGTVVGWKDPIVFHKMEFAIPFLGILSYTLSP
jgi:hypothetical protein